jgi:hypothetical protein
MRTALSLLCVACLCACSHLEPVSNRAIAFNSEVATVQDKTLLLNIVRAAYRYPMHFTELSTLTGTESVSGTAGVTVPFSRLTGGSNGARFGTLSTTVSQQPTFNMAVLETQEFYKGIMAPLGADQIGAFINEGLPPELIYTLVLRAVTFQEKSGKAIDIENNFHPMTKEKQPYCDSSDITEYECFKRILKRLIAKGLSIEATSQFIGPALAESSFDPAGLVKLESAGLKVLSFQAPDCKARNEKCPLGVSDLKKSDEDILIHGGSLYRIQRDARLFRFCFDLALKDPSDAPSKADGLMAEEMFSHPFRSCSDPLEKSIKVVRQGKASFTADSTSVTADSTLTVDSDPFALTSAGARFSFKPRSTEGIIYYLGEIVRCELQLDVDQKKPKSECEAPTVSADYRPEPDQLFAITDKDKALAPTEQRLALEWENREFYVNIDAKAKDRSGEVLRIVSQLVALHKSAKDFPTPTVLPVLSP